jgi:hypothetical protein
MLFPCVDKHLGANLCISFFDPGGDVPAGGGRDGLIRILCHHPLLIDGSELCLESLVAPDVNGLTEASATGGDPLKLDPKHLNCIRDWPHCMDSEQLKDEKGDNIGWGKGNARSKDPIDPLHHPGLVKPCVGLHCINHPRGMSCQLASFDVADWLTCRTKPIT